jgi:hypothetical protein
MYGLPIAHVVGCVFGHGSVQSFGERRKRANHRRSLALRQSVEEPRQFVVPSCNDLSSHTLPLSAQVKYAGTAVFRVRVSFYPASLLKLSDKAADRTLLEP